MTQEAVFLNLHEIHKRQSVFRCHQWVFQAGLELLRSCQCQAKTFHQLPFWTWNIMAFFVGVFFVAFCPCLGWRKCCCCGCFFLFGGMPMMPPPWVRGSWWNNNNHAAMDEVGCFCTDHLRPCHLGACQACRAWRPSLWSTMDFPLMRRCGAAEDLSYTKLCLSQETWEIFETTLPEN